MAALVVPDPLESPEPPSHLSIPWVELLHSWSHPHPPAPIVPPPISSSPGTTITLQHPMGGPLVQPSSTPTPSQDPSAPWADPQHPWYNPPASLHHHHTPAPLVPPHPPAPLHDQHTRHLWYLHGVDDEEIVAYFRRCSGVVAQEVHNGGRRVSTFRQLLCKIISRRAWH